MFSSPGQERRCKGITFFLRFQARKKPLECLLERSNGIRMFMLEKRPIFDIIFLSKYPSIRLLLLPFFCVGFRKCPNYVKGSWHNQCIC